MTRRIWVMAAVAIGALVLVPGLTTAAGKRVAPSFNGSCELSGVATFDHPVTNATEENGGRFRSQEGLANCVGELSAGGVDFGSGTYPVKARARATGPLSCTSGTLRGRSRIVVLGEDGRALKVGDRRVRGWAEIELRHAIAAGGISFFGAGDSRAEGVYNFTPSVGAVANCAGPGDKQLPMAIRFSTTGDFQTR